MISEHTRALAARISVIVVSFQSRATIALCLQALSRQSLAPLEIIVVDSGNDGTADFVAAQHPNVLLLRSAARLFPGDARNLGIHHARGSIIAFVDSDCEADPDWVARLAEAHTAADWIIGGSVGVANPQSLAGWASYLCEFAAWAPIGPIRHLPDIPTCCLSFKREAFAACGPFLEGTYCSDTVFNWRSCRLGHRPLFVPAIHVRHHNPTRLAAIVAKQHRHGRTFAAVRSRHFGWSRTRSALYALGSLLLPPLLWIRIAARLTPLPYYRTALLRATPALIPVLIAWSCGEARGYWDHASDA